MKYEEENWREKLKYQAAKYMKKNLQKVKQTKKIEWEHLFKK